ncbi:MAG: preprotein translocase subunit SecG [Anaerolineae bacterium]|nr:preprotein translocase subunit SecG [Gloeobacterales cyanobacterium ES-bin-313]
MAVILVLLRILWTLSAVVIIVTVLLHAAKGDGLAAIGGSAQMGNSKKTAESTLDKVTWSAVASFLAITTVLSAGWLGRVATPATTAPIAPTAAPVAPPTSTSGSPQPVQTVPAKKPQ